MRLFTPLRVRCIPYASPSLKDVLCDGNPRWLAHPLRPRLLLVDDGQRCPRYQPTHGPSEGSVVGVASSVYGGSWTCCTAPSSARSISSMGLTFLVPANGRIGNALLAARGAHELEAAGQCARLARLAPAHANVRHDGTVTIELRFAMWLAAGMLLPSQHVKTLRIHRYLVGPERLGAALDAALATIAGSDALAVTVLPPRFLRGGERLHPGVLSWSP